LDDFNPYAPPAVADAPAHRTAGASRRGRLKICFAWVAVFFFNMAFPLSVAWSMTGKTGRIGISIAGLVLIAAGCWICAKYRKVGILLVIGGIPIGFTQVYPVLQIIAGVVGLGVGQVLGLIVKGDDADRNLGITELGGFIVTSITGGILMTISAGSGILVERLILNRWRRRRGRSSEA
jgi:hypothetical protein